ncbi:MAG TPA: UDP-N-acetylglucosamine--N-acetylmuramyl-(pentapeptide) pyrophosphoryl-undecaprenol N-acetylglucosamine transferase [Methylomirabilota bacterium]|jgi:UDP-N-acetylglucosamine--N-acetylmuramyl-(pentapeptide) pyrophosphoryl-undecaprenol N-acetylglucosamine transferase|nr:UDP-N-acetylglucosamine--N-acetylmuramyl-(pentapeptide) pyrophosphoryl-undecaprenol N-acetylglucosamine transferase [Methylomirabilota bacterium]
MKILLAGGGSGGPVSPLLAVAAEVKKVQPRTQFLFVGTKTGPERQMVTLAGFNFESIPGAKWRRYFSLKNILSPFVFCAGLIKSFFIIGRFRPNVVFSAGGYVAVPLSWIGKLFGAKIIIHQQDARVGLANKLIALTANNITTSFEYTTKMFYSGSGLISGKLKNRAQWVGNPVRPELLSSKIDPKKYFNLHSDLPVLLILGGATGSVQINKLIEEILRDLVNSYQVVHQTGKGKNLAKFQHSNYHPFELIEYEAYAAILKSALLVVARAGLSTITELSMLGKPSIIIPMPGTHQEDNATILTATNSAEVLSGKAVTGRNLLKVINQLKFDPESLGILSHNIKLIMPHDGAAKISKIILSYDK